MSPLRRFLAIALCLAALVGGTRWLESRAAAGAAWGEDAGARAAEAALAHVDAEVQALERDLHARAAALAADARLHAALLDPAARPQAVRALARLRLPDGYAAELHTPTPELVAWQGPALPLDPATRRLAFLDTLQTAAVADGAFRDAIVAWHPIRDGERVIGAVRVGRLVRVRVPVRNEYLRDFDLAERWARGLPAPLAVTFDEPLGEQPDEARVHRVRGVDGSVIARVVAFPPSPEALERTARRPYTDASAFFLLLLVGWGLFGLGMGVRALLLRALHDGAPADRAAVAAGALALAAAWGGARYALLALDIPARFAGPGPTPPAFDPAFLGSGLGGGVAGSVAELLVTGLFALGAGIGLAVAGLTVLRARKARARLEGDSAPGVRWALAASGAAVLGVSGLGAAAWLLRRATEDATLGYFVRMGPLSDGLVALAFGAFLMVTLGAVLWMAGLALLVGIRGPRRLAGGAAAMAGVWALAYGMTPLAMALPVPLAAAASALVAAMAWALDREPTRWAFVFTFRGALLAAFVATLLTYPIVFGAARDKDDARARDALEDFADGEDARVAFALESVLLDARGSEAVRAALGSRWAPPPGLADSLAADLVAGSLLAALGDYRVRLLLHASDGAPLGVYRDDPAAGGTGLRDELAFERLRRLYEREAGMAGLAVERRAVGERSGRFRYAGLGPVRSATTGEPVGWVTAHAEPRPTRHVDETPFPRVLVPAGLNRLADEEWAFGEFVDGVLLRSRGGDFGRFRLDARAEALAEGGALWTRETVAGQPVRVHYRRLTPERVVAVRVAAVTVFDHLYYLLRLLTPGLALAALGYGLGPFVRRVAGAAAPRPRLRDRVLNRFLLVGLVSVAATGVIGQTAIVTQNRDAVEEQLKRRLARVEAALTEDLAAGDLPPTPERILDRARLDAVGPRLGLDINLYRGAELAASSRSQLVRQRLIEGRLPAEVAEALLVDGHRYAFATERIGRFHYTTGYEALPDSLGRPAVVLAVPTLPEQIAIERDQARMVAYLFGVLLLLVGVIFAVATVLAHRLTQPFRRLREGLRAVGAGEAPAEPIPVERRDEVGEVIETFNAVWDQLGASRRKLAEQERELAWREMARQVAHEIKNPLTPMRLSVQHLRRAYERDAERGAGENGDGRFGEVLERISGTLIEQIDALNRIAGEFSRFARLPEQRLERLDLNEVVRQAAALLREEPRVDVALALAEEPLPVVADREELRRVYINLLVNAQQAVPEGERGTITVTTERALSASGEAEAVGSVRDTGAGVPEDIRDRIFQPNFSTKTSGMGLGLAIARKAVRDLGGEIGFETTPGVGTTFWVRLPLAEGDRPPDPRPREEPGGTRPAEA